MSFNAKNLTYESKEPSFLRKLKSEYSGNNSGRHERPIARPRKLKAADDDDDEPTYVDDESHDTLTKAQYDALMNPKEDHVSQPDLEPTTNPSSKAPAILTDSNESPADGSSPKPENVPPPKKELVAAIGGAGKRRIAKVVGGGGDENEEQDVRKVVPGGKKSTKTKKKVKLSFDDENSEP